MSIRIRLTRLPHGEGLPLNLRVFVGRKDDDGRSVALLAHLADEVEPAAVGKHQIQDHEACIREPLGRFGDAACHARLEAVPLEGVSHRLRDGRLILDDQDPMAHRISS